MARFSTSFETNGGARERHVARRFAGRGFTLVEVLIALTVFAMIAAAGVALLAFSVRAQASGAAKLDDIAALNRMTSVMAADFAQALDRPTRDEQGNVAPAFIAAGDPLVQLVRGGWSNLDAAPRASVQKVAWRFTGAAIERIAWPGLDGAAPLQPVVMLERVGGVTLRFRVAGAWSDTIPAEAGLPQAAELVVTRVDGTRLRQLFLVGGPTPLPSAGEVSNASA